MLIWLLVVCSNKPDPAMYVCALDLFMSTSVPLSLSLSPPPRHTHTLHTHPSKQRKNASIAASYGLIMLSQIQRKNRSWCKKLYPLRSMCSSTRKPERLQSSCFVLFCFVLHRKDLRGKRRLNGNLSKLRPYRVGQQRQRRVRENCDYFHTSISVQNY